MKTVTSKKYAFPTVKDGFVYLYRKTKSNGLFKEPERVKAVKFVDIENNKVTFFNVEV